MSHDKILAAIHDSAVKGFEGRRLSDDLHYENTEIGARGM